MVLISIDQFYSSLVCPKCRTSLHKEDGKYCCINQACTYSDKLYFPILEKQPVLVDFEQSILNREQVLNTSGSSPVIRKNSLLKKMAKKILFPNPIPYRKASLFKDVLKEISETPIVLVIGGGGQGSGTELFYVNSSIRIISFDIYKTPFTQFIADAHNIPLANETVDAVWIQNVLEHVLDPWQVVSEIHRVLKKDGIVYAETPFLQHVHEGAYDFTRFTESGHRWLFRNFELIDSGVVGGIGQQLLWTVERIVRGLFRSVYFGQLIKVLLFWLQYVDNLIPQEYILDGASSIFFMGKKSQNKISPRDIVNHYKGIDKKFQQLS